MVYKIGIVRTAQKQILAMPKTAQIEIVAAVDSLAHEPRPSGCRKLHGVSLWRLRIGHYRSIYAIDDKARQVTVLKIGIRREDTYQGL